VFAVTNVEKLENVRFIVVNVYDDDSGYLVDQIVKPFESYEVTVEILRELNVTEVLTSNSEIAGLLLQTVGIGVQIKHPDDTKDTQQAVEQWSDLLYELFDISPMIPKPKMPRWRRWVYEVLTKITNKVKGGDKYDI
jgi:hypothetical protein